MALGILGKKIGMTQMFDDTGNLIPVTLVLAGPNYVVTKRVKDRDGYEAVQLGFEQKPEKNTNKPDLGRFNKASVPSCRFVREFRGTELADYEVGSQVNVDIFEIGDKIDVIGTSKGRGFASVRKRHNSHPGPRSHGSMYRNKPGSMGQASDPSRVYKGKKLPGQHGNSRVTAQNLEVVKTDLSRNMLVIKGSIPGANQSYVMLRKRVAKAKK